jgi:4-amino-4-deoxy-L-arabinose transferase-like glycosyltransferase
MRTSPSAPPWRYLLSALALYSLVQLLFLGLAPIAGSTEAREAQVIDTIVREGEWILPLRNGIVPSKPPLYHWVGAAISSALGEVSEFTVRVPSHIAAVGILLLSGLAAFRIARFSQTVEGELHQERVALLAPAVLSLTYGFHQLASQAMVDMTFSFLLWGGLTAILWSDPEEWCVRHRISWQSRAIFWSMCALAVLARGPVGLALPIFLVGITGLYLGGLRSTVRELLRPSIGWLAFLLPCAWYYAAYLKGGEAFLARQLLFENVQRFVGGEKINTEAWWFYLPSLLRTTAPWSALMAVGVLRYLSTARGLSYPGGFKRWTVAPTVALLAGVVLFSLASGKRHSYMLPLEPFVAIQCAVLFSSFIERRGLKTRRRLWEMAQTLEGLVACLLVILLTGVGIAHTVDWGHHPLEEIVKFDAAPLTFRAGLVVLFTLGAISLLKRGESRVPYGRVWCLAVILLTLSVCGGNGVKGTMKGWTFMTEQLLLSAQGGKRIAVIKDPFDEYFDPIFFYARRPITILSADKGIEWCSTGTVYLARRSWLTASTSRIPGKIRVVTTLRELKRAFEGGKGEDLEVFTCSPWLEPTTKASEGSIAYNYPDLVRGTRVDVKGRT